MAGQYFIKKDLNFLPLSGGAVSGNTYFNSNLSANTYFSGTTNLEGIIFNIASQVSQDMGLFLPLSGGTGGPYSFTGISTYNNIANGSNFSELVNWSSLVNYIFVADKYVTGGTYDNNTALITFNGVNNFPQFTVDLSSLDLNDTFITEGTISYDSKNLSGILTLNDNGGNSVIVSGVTDVQTTGVTLVGSTVVFDTNESLSAYTVDLSPIIPAPFTCDDLSGCTIIQDIQQDILDLSGQTSDNYYTTGVTLDNNTLFFDRNDVLSAYTIDLSPIIPTGFTNTFVTSFTYDNNNNIQLSLNNSTTFTVNISVLSGLTINGNTQLNGTITSNPLSGTTNRIVEVDDNGIFSANKDFIEAYITSGGTVANLLEDISNWDINGVYIGTAITNTFMGQKHYNLAYFFEAVGDNNWIRLIRG